MPTCLENMDNKMNNFLKLKQYLAGHCANFMPSVARAMITCTPMFQLSNKSDKDQDNKMPTSDPKYLH
jgi:hypothetical protein